MGLEWVASIHHLEWVGSIHHLAVISHTPPPAMYAAGSEDDDDATEQKPAAGSRAPSASAPDSAHVAANVFVQVGLL